MEASDYHLLKYSLIPFLLLFVFFWEPYNPNVGTPSVFLEISDTVLFLFLLFSLFCSASVISSILSYSSLIHSSASVILSYWFSLVYFYLCYCVVQDFLGGSNGKESVCNAGDLGSILGSGRSPGEGNDNQFQYSFLENPMNRGAWQGYSPWSRKELDMTKWLTLFLHLLCYSLLSIFISLSPC